jgi:hypothetical protein
VSKEPLTAELQPNRGTAILAVSVTGGHALEEPQALKKVGASQRLL